MDHQNHDDNPQYRENDSPEDSAKLVQAEARRSEVAPKPYARTGYPMMAWLLILALVGFLIWEANSPEPAKQGVKEERVSFQVELTAKILVGAATRLSPDWNPWILNQAAQLKASRSIPERLAYVIMVAELQGPEEALGQMQALAAAETEPAVEETAAADISEADQRLIEILTRVFQARAQSREPELSADERTELENHLGWLGQLAPVTEGTTDVQTRQAVLANVESFPIVLGGVVVWYLVCGLVGAGAIITLLILASLGRLQHGFRVRGNGAIYAETFAIWLVIILALRRVGAAIVTPGTSIPINIIIAMIALIALAWPVIRGIPWREVRQDVGLYLPPKPWRELFIGPLAYCMVLPFLLCGFAMTMALTVIREWLAPGAPMPSHPVQEVLAGADLSTIIQVMILGVIIAPFAEEIMFRGVLYRHMREASNRWGIVLSMLLTAVVTSFIFSAIHPQGWVTIPALMGLAMGFCLAREWRGSLMASMIAHGITNFVTLLLNVLLFSSG